jgi:hypothetical protein
LRRSARAAESESERGPIDGGAEAEVRHFEGSEVDDGQ